MRRHLRTLLRAALFAGALGLLGACAGPPRKSVLATAPEVAREGPLLSARVVERARSYLGAPYRYGGEGPHGFDCSGFVRTVYAAFGVKLPRSCAAQSRRGEPVRRAQLAEGDLVFFGREGSPPSHVGIYAGDDRFVHASTGRGKVRVDTLKERWFARHYRGARRVVPRR